MTTTRGLFSSRMSTDYCVHFFLFNIPWKKKGCNSGLIAAYWLNWFGGWKKFNEIGEISLAGMGNDDSLVGTGGCNGRGTDATVDGVGRLKADNKSSIRKLLLIVVAIFMFVFQSSDNRCSSTFSVSLSLARSLVCVSIVKWLTRISITNCKQSKWERREQEREGEKEEEISLVLNIENEKNTMLIGRECFIYFPPFLVLTPANFVLICLWREKERRKRKEKSSIRVDVLLSILEDLFSLSRCILGLSFLISTDDVWIACNAFTSRNN